MKKTLRRESLRRCRFCEMCDAASLFVRTNASSWELHQTGGSSNISKKHLVVNAKRDACGRKQRSVVRLIVCSVTVQCANCLYQTRYIRKHSWYDIDLYTEHFRNRMCAVKRVQSVSCRLSRVVRSANVPFLDEKDFFSNIKTHLCYTPRSLIHSSIFLAASP